MAADMVWLLLPETLRQRAPEPVSPLSILRSYRRFLERRGSSSFISASRRAACRTVCLDFQLRAFVLQDIYGLSALAFGLAFAVGIVGLSAGHAHRGRL